MSKPVTFTPLTYAEVVKDTRLQRAHYVIGTAALALAVALLVIHGQALEETFSLQSALKLGIATMSIAGSLL